MLRRPLVVFVLVCSFLVFGFAVNAGEVIYKDNWAEGDLSMWEFPWFGNWELKDGVLTQNDTTGSMIALLDDIILEDMALNVKAKAISIGPEGWHGMRIAVRAYGTLTRYVMFLTPNGVFAYGLTPIDEYFELGANTEFRIEAGVEYDLRLEIQGFRMALYINGNLILEAEDVDERIWDGGVALLTIFSEVHFRELSLEALD